MITREQLSIIQRALKNTVKKNESGTLVFLTVGQSLLLSIKACKEKNVSPKIIKALKSLYLNGVRTPEDKEVIQQIGYYFSDNHQYSITTNPKDINNDPVRRYFETHLAYNMLEISTKSLDTETLKEFTSNLKTNLYQHTDKSTKIEYILAGNMHSSLNKYELEYAEMIHKLMKHDFHGLSPEACDKLCEIARSTILATENTKHDKNMPADIYADSIFVMGIEGRGRIVKRGTRNHLRYPAWTRVKGVPHERVAGSKESLAVVVP